MPLCVSLVFTNSSIFTGAQETVLERTVVPAYIDALLAAIIELSGDGDQHGDEGGAVGSRQ